MRELAIAAADELALSELGISVVGLLGKGHFGSVLLGERSDGTAVAVKLALRLDPAIFAPEGVDGSPVKLIACTIVAAENECICDPKAHTARARLGLDLG